MLIGEESVAVPAEHGIPRPVVVREKQIGFRNIIGALDADFLGDIRRGEVWEGVTFLVRRGLMAGVEKIQVSL